MTVWELQVESMRRSAAVVVSVGIADAEHMEPIVMTHLGMAVLLGKPIVAVVPRGREVSEKLARCVDRFIELDPANPQGSVDAIQEAANELAREDT